MVVYMTVCRVFVYMTVCTVYSSTAFGVRTCVLSSTQGEL